LEPSFGAGNFIFELAKRANRLLTAAEFRSWCGSRLFGCEIDREAYESFAGEWTSLGWGVPPEQLTHDDFFRWMPPDCDRGAATSRPRYFASRTVQFDLVIGNPPFGASIDPRIQDELDAIFGFRGGMKIKKESYAFFIVKSLDLLKPGGR